jgi:hypothetical protein
MNASEFDLRLSKDQKKKKYPTQSNKIEDIENKNQQDNSKNI